MASSSAHPGFDHERLDVYNASLEFIGLAHDCIAAFPRGKASLADQLEHAATSIALNTAEGAGEFSGKEKARFYRMALRSATECAAILDVGCRLGAIHARRRDDGKLLLNRIAAMLLALIHRVQAEGPAPGPGPGSPTRS